MRALVIRDGRVAHAGPADRFDDEVPEGLASLLEDGRGEDDDDR